MAYLRIVAGSGLDHGTDGPGSWPGGMGCCGCVEKKDAELYIAKLKEPISSDTRSHEIHVRCKRGGITESKGGRCVSGFW